jgi:hypothetical protein
MTASRLSLSSVSGDIFVLEESGGKNTTLDGRRPAPLERGMGKPSANASSGVFSSSLDCAFPRRQT